MATTVGEVKQAVYEAAYKDGISDGANRSAEALKNLGEQSETTSTKLGAAGKSSEALANRYDVVTKTTNQLAAAERARAQGLETMKAAVDGGAKTQDQANAVMAAQQAKVQQLAALLMQLKAAQADGATQAQLQLIAQGKLTGSYGDLGAVADKYGKSVGQASFAQRQFGIQMIQTFSSVQAGTPIFTALIQQGHQIADVALSTGTGFGVIAEGIKKAALAAASFVTSGLGLMITGLAAVTGALVTFAVQAEHAASLQAKLRTELSATRNDAITLADVVIRAGKEVGASTTASVAAATAAAQVIAATSTFSGGTQALINLTKTAVGLADVLGITIPDAAKKVSAAISDPAKTATDLALQGLRTLDAATLDTIIHLQAIGDKAGAAALTTNALKVAADGVVKTHLDEAMSRLSQAFTSTGESGKSLANVIGTALDDGLARLIDKLTTAVGWLSKLKDQMDKAGSTLDQIKREGGVVLSPGAPLPTGPGGRLDIGSTVSPANPEMLQSQIQSAAITLKVDPAFLSALQSVEGVLTSSGNWQAGGTGSNAALGPFQVKPSLFGGMRTDAGSYPTIASLGPNASLTDQGTNVEAGAAYAAHVLRKYGPGRPGGSVALAVMAYHDGETVIDNFLQGIGEPSQQARDEATKLVGRYGGTGLAGGALGGATFGPPIPTAADKAGMANAAYQGQLAVQGVLDLPTILAQDKAITDLSQKLRELSATRQAITEKPTFDPEDAGEIARVDKAIAQTKVDLENAIEPTRKQTNETKDLAAADAILGEANSKLFTIRAQIARQRAENPQAPESEAAAARQIAAAMDLQAAGAQKLVAQVALTVKGNNDLAKAWDGGAQSAAKAQIAVEAHSKALQFFSTDDAPTFERHEKDIATLLEQEAQSRDHVKVAAEAFDLQHQIDMVQLESDTLGKNGDERAKLISHMQSEYELRQKLPNATNAEIESLVRERDALEANSLAFEHQKETLDFLSNQFTSAFSTIADAITQAFVQGQGQAVNWGNVVKAVISQVIKAFLELSIINPIVNGLFGKTLPTLFDALGVVGGGGAGGGGGSGFLQVLGLGQQALGVGNAVSGGGLSNSLGLSELTQPSGFFGTNGTLSGIMNAGIFGTSTSEAASLSANAALFGEGFGAIPGGSSALGTAGTFGVASAEGAAGSTIGSTGLFGGATIGAGLGALGTVGLGYGIGSTIGGLTQKSFNKVGPGPNIGAGIGAVGGLAGGLATGAALGSVVPVIGTIIGAIIGAIAGSAFGPRPASPYSQTVVGVTQGGRLDIGVTNSQLVDATAERKQAIADIAAINSALNATGTQISSIVSNDGPGRHLGLVNAGDLTSLQIGQNSPKGTPDPSKINDLQSGFWKFRFSSPEYHLNEFLKTGGDPTYGGGRGFNSSAEFNQTVTAIQNFITATAGTDFASHIDATLANIKGLGIANKDIAAYLAPIQEFVTKTVPGLLAFDHVTGSLGDRISQLHAQFDGAIATAHQLGYKEQELTAARDRGILAAENAATAAVYGPSGILPNLQQREAAANATISGDPAMAQQAQLAAFDIQAAAQRTQLHDQIVGIYGDAITTSTMYASLQAQLEKTLGQERLAIQKQANAALVQDAQATADKANIIELGFNVRRETARLAVGINTPNPYIPEANGGNITQKALSLYEFDQITAPQQRDQWKQQLIGIFGAAYTTSADFASRMNELETTLGAERVALAQKYDDQILQTISGTVTSLTDYAHSLQTSQASPLSPLAQYDLAQKQFNAVSGAAKAGDYNSVQKLQSYSDALLNASRAVFGSGAGYASDFEKVLDALNLVAQASPDTLTASVYTQETRTQTQTLADGQTALAGLLQSILTELQQGSSRPARAA